MTIKMRLDTAGLRALIKDNPEIELEIAQNVQDNIRDDLVKKGIDGALERALAELVYVSGWGLHKTVTMNHSIKQAVNDMILEHIEENAERFVKAKLYDLVRVVFEEERKKLQKDLEAMQGLLQDAMRSSVTKEFAEDLIKEKLFS